METGCPTRTRKMPGPHCERGWRSTPPRPDLAEPEEWTTRVPWPGRRGTGRSPCSTVHPLLRPTPPVGPFHHRQPAQARSSPCGVLLLPAPRRRHLQPPPRGTVAVQWRHHGGVNGELGTSDSNDLRLNLARPSSTSPSVLSTPPLPLSR